MAQPARQAEVMTPIRRAVAEVGRRVVGQETMVERLMIGLLTGGHVLLEGVPGLAKTLAVRTLSEIIHASFSRIQFTPDLLPADVIGTMVYDQKTQQFGVRKGPIFANIILADEINRAPAKVQSALLEAMQERQVTIAGTSYQLEEPFLVLATQNPIESEGTYPLPEAQLDRFLLKVLVGYPGRNDEKEILLKMSSGEPIPVEPQLHPKALMEARREVLSIQLDQRLVDYIVDLVRATREPNPLVSFGASPRASIALAQASRAMAYLRGRRFVVPEDVQAVAPDVMRHRIVLTFEAEAEDVTTDTIVQKVLASVRAP
ncbi:MAG TPA: MoxR family ATPase [Gemmatimonadales bacterium]|nr:MoxR family ATPase [Gemmatimonadales bacterium]